MLGESCDDVNLFCEDARKQECMNGFCQCKTGNREVSELEFFSLPSFTECVPQDFLLGKENNINMFMNISVKDTCRVETLYAVFEIYC